MVRRCIAVFATHSGLTTVTADIYKVFLLIEIASHSHHFPTAKLQPVFEVLFFSGTETKCEFQ